jgi:hypothetical protein
MSLNVSSDNSKWRELKGNEGLGFYKTPDCFWSIIITNLLIC